jgi:hypothetical protein
MIIDFSSAGITKEFILSKVSEEEIFERYGCTIVPYMFCSPLRPDRNPTCSFRRTQGGRLILRDWKPGEFWGDCFSYVKEKEFTRSFGATLLLIARDFGLVKDDVVQDIERIPRPPDTRIEMYEPEKSVDIRIMRKSWTDRELEYWCGKYDFKLETLDKFKVTPIERAWLNGKPFYADTGKELAFAYHFGGYEYKLYFPERRKFRFIHSSSEVLQGYEQLPEYGDLLVVTKSMKDVMKMHEFSIPAVGPQSENIWTIPRWDEMKQRFLRQMVFGDNDVPGRKFIRNVSAIQDIPGICAPLSFPKDFTDIYEAYGEDAMEGFIEHVLHKLNF